MNVGDRVKHKKYGIGTVKALYPQYHAVRVVYDSEHESTNAIKRLVVVPKDWGVAKPPEEREQIHTQPDESRRGKISGTTVTYDLLRRAREHFSALFPEAEAVVSRLYQNKVYCEVWSHGAAKIHFYEEKR